MNLVAAGYEVCVHCTSEEGKAPFKEFKIEVMDETCEVFLSSSTIFTYLVNAAEIQKVESFKFIVHFTYTYKFYFLYLSGHLPFTRFHPDLSGTSSRKSIC